MLNLTAPQKSVMETDNFFKNTSISNIGGYAIFEKKVNFAFMKEAINQLIQNADGLRLHFQSEKDLWKQKIVDYQYQTIEEISVVGNILEVTDQWMQTPFDLKGDLYDFKLFHYQGNDGIFIKLHHVISDAWSMTIVLSKVIEYYEILLKGEKVNDEIPSYQLFIENEKKYKESNHYEKDKQYWLEKYKEKPTYVSLTHKSGNTNPEGMRKSFLIPREKKEKWEEFCANYKISIAVLFEAVVSLYAARINNVDEITLCSLALNRSGRIERKTVGMFHNILPMTVYFSWQDSFLDLCQKITKEHYQIFRHQKYPYDKIMQSISEKYGVSNIYDIMVSFQNAQFTENQTVKYKSHWNFNGYAELNFMMNIDDLENSGGFHINIDYRKEAFQEDEIEAIFQRFMYIIEQILEKPTILFQEIEIVTPKEKKEILEVFNDTKKEYPKEKRLFDYLEEQVRVTPNKVALRWENQVMTYQELNEKVNSLAHYILTQTQKQSNAILAVMLERSFDMLIAIYAILKAGCAYMPIDPHFPEDRIKFMLEDSEAPLLITHKKWGKKFLEQQKCIYLDEFDYEQNQKENPNLTVSSQDIAYVIYTSGSTGKPKGAKIQHHSVSNRIQWMHQKYPLEETDVILQKTPYTFDVSVWELFWWSMYGGCLQILVPEGHKDPKELIEAIALGKVTHIHFVPSMLNAFLVYLENNPQWIKKLQTLKYVFASGEALQSEHVKKFYQLFKNTGTTLHNLYGPTECTVDVSYYDCLPENIPSSIPIGKPVDNTQLLILDKACNLLPIGVSGELHISGELVGKGYIKREELTKEKFIDNPYYDFPTMYKTGDLAKWLPDGNIEYLGRMDCQVKIRGLRVELGDIETAILQYPSVTHCVVTVFEHLGEQYLCGYFTAKTKIDCHLLKAKLIQELPDYMVPLYYMQLEKIPVNHNGKVDRKALPKPSIDSEEEYKAPENEIEEQIQKCVEKVLKREKISVESDLLTSGLTSLGVITVMTQLSTLGMEIKVREFYENRTIRDLAKMLMEKQSKDKKKIMDEKDREDEKYRDISDIKKIKALPEKKGNILLTGATGFLGIHLLEELYHNTTQTIYCLIRKMDKFEDFIKNYTSIPWNDKRIVPFLGDIADEKLGLTEERYSSLLKEISVVVHSAANVSFFCSWEKAKAINYTGTCNIIKFVEASKAKLHHISTMSVSGDILTTQTIDYPQFTENNLYIGQRYQENVYAHSKYLAEREIIKAIREGRITACIYRLPNLTWRMKDGVFQKNYQENDIYMMTRVMYRLKKVPLEIKDENILLTPADDLARAIVGLMNCQKGNQVFHLVSSSSPTVKKYMGYLTDVTYEPMATLYQQLKTNQKDDEMQFVAMYLSGVIENTKKAVVHVESEDTAKLLKEIGYQWGEIDSKYVQWFGKIDEG